MQCWAGSPVPWEGALLHLLAVHLDVRDVVLKDGGDVDLWELILAEDNEEAGLPAGPIAHNHQLLSDRSHGWGWQGRGSADLGRGLPSPKAFLWAPQDLPEAKASRKRRARGLRRHVLAKTQLLRQLGSKFLISESGTGLPPMGQNTEVGGGKPSHLGARQHEF